MCDLRFAEDLTEDERALAEDCIKWVLVGGSMPGHVAQKLDELIARIDHKRSSEKN